MRLITNYISQPRDAIFKLSEVLITTEGFGRIVLPHLLYTTFLRFLSTIARTVANNKESYIPALSVRLSMSKKYILSTYFACKLCFSGLQNMEVDAPLKQKYQTITRVVYRFRSLPRNTRSVSDSS